LGRSDATHLIAVVEQGAPDVSLRTGELAAVGLAFVDADRARHKMMPSISPGAVYAEKSLFQPDP
jgi:hypothetical protein